MLGRPSVVSFAEAEPLQKSGYSLCEMPEKRTSGAEAPQTADKVDPAL
jgi:hypothetical protein